MTEYVAKGNNEIHVLLLICSQRVFASSVRDDWASFIQTDQIFFQRGFFQLGLGRRLQNIASYVSPFQEPNTGKTEVKQKWNSSFSLLNLEYFEGILQEIRIPIRNQGLEEQLSTREEYMKAW